MAIEVFNRYENKYMLDEQTVNRILRRLSDYMELDDYNKKHETYSISNTYYDTPDSFLIRESLMKPTYKEKLRLRSYGVPKSDTKVYVEIKKKVAGLTNKRRSAMKLAEAYSFLETGRLPEFMPYMNRQVLREVQYILESHQLSPALILSYDRRAYFGIGQHDLRVSFDTNIFSRHDNLYLEAGTFGTRLLDDGKWLMEIKARRAFLSGCANYCLNTKSTPLVFPSMEQRTDRTLQKKYREEYICLKKHQPRSLKPQLVQRKGWER